MLAIPSSLDRLAASLGSGPFASFPKARRGPLEGEYEVRNADGSCRRMQKEKLLLPAPLAAGFAHLAPLQNVTIPIEAHALTLWAPQELVELQVGYRWNGFSGKRMVEWDERFVVFAEDGGDPLAMRSDEPDGPVWLAHRGEGRYAFFAAAPSLAAFYEALAILVETRSSGSLADGLTAALGDGAKELWLWKQLVSREKALR